MTNKHTEISRAIARTRMDARAGFTRCTKGKTVPCGRVCRQPKNCAKGKGAKERKSRIGEENLKEFALARRSQLKEKRKPKKSTLTSHANMGHTGNDKKRGKAMQATNPTKEQFTAKLSELKDKRLNLILETGTTSTEEFFIQEELDDVERKIKNYTKRMNELYGA